MTLTRREWLATLPLGAMGVVGCAGASQAPSRAKWVNLFEGSGHGPKGTIIVFMPETSQTKEVWTGLVDELQRDFKLLAIRVETAADFATIAQAIQQHHPVALVLINNPTVAAYP